MPEWKIDKKANHIGRDWEARLCITKCIELLTRSKAYSLLRIPISFFFIFYLLTQPVRISFYRVTNKTYKLEQEDFYHSTLHSMSFFVYILVMSSLRCLTFLSSIFPYLHSIAYIYGWCCLHFYTSIDLMTFSTIHFCLRLVGMNVVPIHFSHIFVRADKAEKYIIFVSERNIWFCTRRELRLSRCPSIASMALSKSAKIWFRKTEASRYIFRWNSEMKNETKGKLKGSYKCNHSCEFSLEKNE